MPGQGAGYRPPKLRGSITVRSTIAKTNIITTMTATIFLLLPLWRRGARVSQRDPVPRRPGQPRAITFCTLCRAVFPHAVKATVLSRPVTWPLPCASRKILSLRARLFFPGNCFLISVQTFGPFIFISSLLLVRFSAGCGPAPCPVREQVIGPRNCVARSPLASHSRFDCAKLPQPSV